MREAEERIAVTGADRDKISARPGEDPRTTHLKAVIRSLSTTASSRPLLRRSKVRGLLTEILKKGKQVTTESSESSDITNLEWVATGKATAQTYGLILD